MPRAMAIHLTGLAILCVTSACGARIGTPHDPDGPRQLAKSADTGDAGGWSGSKTVGQAWAGQLHFDGTVDDDDSGERRNGLSAAVLSDMFNELRAVWFDLDADDAAQESFPNGIGFPRPLEVGAADFGESRGGVGASGEETVSPVDESMASVDGNDFGEGDGGSLGGAASGNEESKHDHSSSFSWADVSDEDSFEWEVVQPAATPMDDRSALGAFYSEVLKLRQALGGRGGSVREQLDSIRQTVFSMARAPNSARDFEDACEELLDLRAAFLNSNPKGSVAVFRTWMDTCVSNSWSGRIPFRPQPFSSGLRTVWENKPGDASVEQPDV
mmetsp:Transcript_127903/g.370157  ORF Transcript_127903/g.370157 Transcript_127903/m.370157 type:complete len:329 (+) Transcript_127903:48-1034(+)